MSIESLVDKIMSDTKKASSEIEKKATDEARACDEKTKEEIQRIEKAGREKAARLSQERKQRMISMAELEDRKNLLGVKQEVIEEAFSAAVEKVLSFDPEYYGDFLINLILQADPQGSEEILVNETDRARLGNGWVGHLNQRLEQAGKKSEMAIGEEIRHIRGGAILRKGRKEVNCSLESILLSKRNELETEVAGILFKDSE
jgi:V/A-type H+-transporting ATPase subunit E